MNAHPVTVSDDQLVSELWARDVQFLMGRPLSSKPQLTPANFIALLAESENARVRLSLIPLFLRHPELSDEVEKADKLISTQAKQTTLRFFYTAALLLQKKYRERIHEIFGEQSSLPDLFSVQSGISLDAPPDQALAQLAQRHRILSGRFINWTGTYEHAAEVWLKQMELQRDQAGKFDFNPDIRAHLQELKKRLL